MGFFVPTIAIFLIFYFLVIRPQQKQMSEHKKMLEALKKGDRVLTSGGVYGTVVSLRGPDVELKVAENVKLLVARSAISQLANPSAELAQSAPTDS
ncbi:MAG: preprotein translocase subunit YajC [Elusimicrobiota bacterium]